MKIFGKFAAGTVMCALALAASLGSQIATAAQTPANPATGPKTGQLLNWLSDLKTRPVSKILSGQFVSPNYGRPEKGFPTVQDAWNYHIEDLKTNTGKYVGLVGFDLTNRTYQGGTSAENTPACNNITSLSQSFHNAGGIIHLTWHAGNPFTLGNAWSAVPAGHTLFELTQTGNQYNTQWMSWLSAAADCLQWYSNQGIPVIWRPFHEQDGSWFWWGTGSDSDYVLLWKHMFDYFTQTRGLNNLLWVWSPNSYASATKLTAMYPGDSYVDILGIDRYADAATSSSAYNWMNAKGNKVIFFAEVGKKDGTAAWDTTRITTEINTYFPNAAGFMAWMKTGTDFSLVGNNNAATLMNDPGVVTLERAKWYVVDDTSTADISYSGPWTSSADANYFNGTKAVSNTTGAYAQMTFTGTAVAVTTKKLPAGGKFDVYIDNVFQATVDTYSATDQYQQQVYKKTGLSNASHTIKLLLNGQTSGSGYYVGLDYLSYMK